MTAPLAWLIDTNVVSEMMRPMPEPRVAAVPDSISGEGLGLASVTVWEVFDGIGRLAPGRRRRGEAFDDHVPDAFLAAAAAALRAWRGDAEHERVPQYRGQDRRSMDG